MAAFAVCREEAAAPASTGNGNKRTAFVTALTFLRLNGSAFCPDTIESVRMVEIPAAGEISEADFATWLATGMTAICLTEDFFESRGNQHARPGWRPIWDFQHLSKGGRGCWTAIFPKYAAPDRYR